MSYDRDESYEGGRHHQEGRHHHGHQQEAEGYGGQYGEDATSDFQRNRDGFAETGGYGPEAQDPEYHERQRRQREEREAQRFGGGSEIPGSYGAGSRIKEPEERQQHHGGHQRRDEGEQENEYQSGGGRRFAGSGVGSVELREGGNQGFRSDAYGGESGTQEYSYGDSERRPEQHQGRQQHQAGRTEGESYNQSENQGGERRQQHGRQNYEQNEEQGRHGRSNVGSGVDSVALTEEGDRRRLGDMYGGESGTSRNNNTGEWDVSSGEKYTPGATVRLHAAERETEKNPFNGMATGMAGETQTVLKQGLKSLEEKLMESFEGSRR